jgi:hypothetical protein
LVALSLSVVCAVSGAGEEIYGKPDAPLAAEVLGVAIHTDDPDEMQYVILQKLTDRYAADHGIEVQPEEIAAYIARLEKDIEQDRKEGEARRAEIVRKLQAQDLPEDERKRLAAQLDALNELLAATDAAAGRTAANPKEDKAAREWIASSFIRQWKINRALYEQYGGRIVFQQGGPEPLDAYRKFLQEQEKQGAFVIVKKEFEPEFWKYYVTDSMHSFYQAGSEEEARAFQDPWWLSH